MSSTVRTFTAKIAHVSHQMYSCNFKFPLGNITFIWHFTCSESYIKRQAWQPTILGS